MQGPAPEQQVFANRNTRMDTIGAVGFDMDYTLARYHRDQIEMLAHRLALGKLVDRGYPEEILAFRYTPDFVIRGLTIDKQTGNILKLDRHNHVGRVFHGRRRLTKRERRTAYRRERLDFTPPRFALVDTLFSLPEVCIYADLVELLGSRTDVALDPWKLFDDTRECIDEAHRDNTLKSVILSDIATYIEKDPLLGRTLHKLRSSGKKLFLLTNSYWEYTDAVMSYLLAGQLAEYPNWRSYFEWVLVGARKPKFFTGHEPFAQLDAQGQVRQRPVKRLTREFVYEGGNIRHFERALRLGGDQVLYVGDHIYGDILQSKKTSLWRTALVIEELEREIRQSAANHGTLETLSRLEQERRRLDDLTNIHRRMLAALEKLHPKEGSHRAEVRRLKDERAAAKRETKRIIAEMDRLQRGLDKDFNPHWGMVFKEEHENSRFGEQVAEYACLYTSRVANFLHYSAYQYFRSPRDYMPHERSDAGLDR